MYGRSKATQTLLGLGLFIATGLSQSPTGFANSPLDGTIASLHRFNLNKHDIDDNRLFSWRRPSCPGDDDYNRASLDSYMEGHFLTTGTPPNEFTADIKATRIVYFGVELSNLRQVDTGSSTFEAEIWLSLMWHDDFSKTRATNATEQECNFYCDPQHQDCCDNVWVPQFTISNILEVSQIVSLLGGYKNYGETTSGDTTWDLRLDATFSTELNFRDFPFDSQALKVNFFIPQHANVYFQPLTGLTSTSDGANTFFQDVRKASTADGWMLQQVYLEPLCNATSWARYFRYRYYCLEEELAAMPDITTPQQFKRSQQREMDLSLEHLGKDCPPFQDGEYTQKRFTDLLKQTSQEYDKCTAAAWNISRPPSVLIGSDPHGFKNDTDPNNASVPMSMHCLMQAVSKVTRPGYEMTIRVKRYRGYYVIKLFVPVVACVIFAFTAFALPVTELLGRLTVIVPAVIALTALQALVVATDVPVVSILVPTSYLMLCAYSAQLLMALASVFAYSRWQCMHQGQKGKSEKASAEAKPHYPDSPLDVPEMKASISSQPQDRPFLTWLRTTGRKMAMVPTAAIDRCICLILVVLYIVSLIVCVTIPTMRNRKGQGAPAGALVVFPEHPIPLDN